MQERIHKNYNGNDRGHGSELLDDLLSARPDSMILFVGSVNCLRHKPFRAVSRLMREGRAALLCPTMTDFSTGRYLRQIVEAVVELSGERGVKAFTIVYGCQWVILSTDGELLQQELSEEHGIDLFLCDDSHLEFGDHN